jgi:uncharacterized protein (TIGR03435 family)
MTYRTSVGLLLAVCVARGQTATGHLSFEVASVRASEPITSKSAADGKFRVGTQVDGARVDIGYTSLTELVRQAYGLKNYQVTAPDWMSGERYDIHAKLPEGGTKDQVPEMLQSLLADRFKLTFHRESKEHQVYGLIVGKNGLQLKEVAPDTPPSAGQGVTTRKSPSGGIEVHMDENMTMPALCDFLGKMVDRAVVDMTGLTATYDVALDIPANEFKRMLQSGSNSVFVSNSAGSEGPRPAADSASEPAGGSAMFAYVQQLGLKLEPRKAPLELLVVDHAEKVPTEN